MPKLLAGIIALALIAAPHAWAEEAGYLSATWKTKNYGPMVGSFGFAFSTTVGPPPAPELYWRVPDAIEPADEEGSFTFTLPPGDYYLGGLKRDGDQAGPLEKGNIIFLSRDNKGTPLTYRVVAGKTTRAGTISEAEVYEPTQQPARKITAIEGRIIDEGGAPVSGAVVLAYVNRDLAGRPLFVSDPSDSNGRYRLRVGGTGTYFLKIRKNYGGGRPETIGEITGVYGTVKDPAPVAVKAATVRGGIDIQGKAFRGRGRLGNPPPAH